MKDTIKAAPIVGPISRAVARRVRMVRFPGSADYWEARYAKGGTSGAGSYGIWADYKASVINALVDDESIQTVIEWGCGDGNQLSLASYPRYIGVDVAQSAVDRCISRFAQDHSKSFYNLRSMADNAGLFRAELAISLEVVFHLVEDEVFDTYMRRLFDSAERFVVIYSTDDDAGVLGPHERRRSFTPWVQTNAPTWRLVERRIRTGKTDMLESDFYVYARDPGHRDSPVASTRLENRP